MSRIIIKNVPKVFTEKEVTAHFGQSYTVTDCKVARDAQGKSRGFAFVGFKGASDAAAAQKKFNNTFLGASKIRIEAARLRDEEEPSRERSRDQSNQKPNSRQEKQKMEVFESYKQMVQERSKKSWDDLIVPQQRDFSELEATEAKDKSQVKTKPETRKQQSAKR
jgi:multiple RNA-binding domain-containing protein 1